MNFKAKTFIQKKTETAAHKSVLRQCVSESEHRYPLNRLGTVLLMADVLPPNLSGLRLDALIGCQSRGQISARSHSPSQNDLRQVDTEPSGGVSGSPKSNRTDTTTTGLKCAWPKGLLSLRSSPPMQSDYFQPRIMDVQAKVYHSIID